MNQSQKGLFRMISLKQEFSEQLHKFLNPSQGQKGKISLNLAQSRFPYLFHDKTIAINTIYIFVKLKDGKQYTNTISVNLTPPGSGSVTQLDLQQTSDIGGLPQDSMTGSFTSGTYILEEVSGIGTGKIEDIGILCRYTVS